MSLTIVAALLGKAELDAADAEEVAQDLTAAVEAEPKAPDADDGDEEGRRQR